jgi:hypothetical protein
MSPPPGPKEAAQRANGDANRKRRSLIPYAGKEKGGVERWYGNRGNFKPDKPVPTRRNARKDDKVKP